MVRQEIGIVLATEAVRQLGGRLWIDANAPGQGTTVSFTMRASSPGSMADPPVNARPEGGLVVDLVLG